MISVVIEKMVMRGSFRLKFKKLEWAIGDEFILMCAPEAAAHYESFNSWVGLSTQTSLIKDNLRF